MAEDQPVGRRTALRTLGTVAAVATGASTASAATGANTDTEHSDSEFESDLTGLYSGTVDRIVDGEHVVILVEDGGSVVDQHVVPANDYPYLGEGDPVYLFILLGTVLGIWPASAE